MNARSVGARSVMSPHKVSSGRGALPPLARLTGAQGPCRCAGEDVGPHQYGRGCWERGREPLTRGIVDLRFVSERELDEIREAAHEDGYAQAEHDLDDDRVSVDAIVGALRSVKSSQVVRKALGEVLDLEPDSLKGPTP